MNISKNISVSDKLSDTIRRHEILFDDFDRIYLFGSIVTINALPNDIDLLLIYAKRSKELIDKLSIITSLLEEVSGLPAHLTVLSLEEEYDTGFLKKINAIILK